MEQNKNERKEERAKKKKQNKNWKTRNINNSKWQYSFNENKTHTLKQCINNKIGPSENSYRQNTWRLFHTSNSTFYILFDCLNSQSESIKTDKSFEKIANVGLKINKTKNQIEDSVFPLLYLSSQKYKLQ